MDNATKTKGEMDMKIFALIFLVIAQPVFAAILPRPDHIVVVVEENHAYNQIIGSTDAPYINELAGRGMLFTNAHAVTHPSQPNYIALFAGNTYGVTNDNCVQELTGPNVADSLRKHGQSYAMYAEGLPAAGSTDCIDGNYRRKHNPASNWKDLADVNLPLTAFPKDFSKLPTVSWVIPNLQHDMHDGTIAQADTWLKQHLAAYADWAVNHNSLLIVTWDEDNYRTDNHITTFFVGQPVQRGRNAQRIDHYAVLRTIEEMYGLPLINNAKHAHTIEGVWSKIKHHK